MEHRQLQYYFDLRHDGDTAPGSDPEGMELPDMKAVRSEALTSIREILGAALHPAWNPARAK